MTYLFIFLSIIFWASSFVGIRFTIKDYSPIELAAFRFIIASVILIAIAYFKKIKLPAKKDLIYVLFMGSLLFLNILFLNYGAMTIKAGEISFLLSTSTLFTVILAFIFLKESISVKFIIGLIISLLGVALISLNISSGFSFNLNIAFILLASVTYSSFFILQKSFLKKYNSFELTSYSIWIVTLLILPLSKNLFTVIPSVSIYPTIAVIYIGIFPTVISFLCWSLVLSRIEVSKASVYLYLIPVFTIVIGYIWLDEIPTLTSLIGGIIVIAGLSLANMKNFNSIIKRA